MKIINKKAYILKLKTKIFIIYIITIISKFIKKIVYIS